MDEAIKIRSYWLGALVVSALFFGYFSTVYIIDPFTSSWSLARAGVLGGLLACLLIALVVFAVLFGAAARLGLIE